LENVSATVSNIPTFKVVPEGAQIRFPDGIIAPPVNAAPEIVFEYVKVGVTETMFDDPSPMMFPEGARNTELRFEVPVSTFVKFPPRPPLVTTHEVLYIAEFDPTLPPKNIFPFGKRRAPEKLDDGPANVGPTLMYVRVVGFKSPMFPVAAGHITTLPVGLRAPPENAEPVMTLVDAIVRGLRTIAFDAVPGTKTTLPFGTSTPPRSPVATKFTGLLVYRLLTGLKNPTTDPLVGTSRTLPSGKRRLPNHVDAGVGATLPKEGRGLEAHQDREG